jgi:hypothetical protein
MKPSFATLFGRRSVGPQRRRPARPRLPAALFCPLRGAVPMHGMKQYSPGDKPN